MSFAPRISLAVSSPAAKGRSGSSVPWMTSVGVRNCLTAFARFPLASSAISCRRVAMGSYPMRGALFIASSSSSGVGLYFDPESAVRTVLKCALSASGEDASPVPATARIARREPKPVLGFPTADEMDVSVATRFGHCVAKTCAIMPPIETPATCTRRMPR